MQTLERRSLFKALLAAIPAAVIRKLALAQTVSSEVKVAAGQDRFNVGRALGVSATTRKVATPDTAGALFVMEKSNWSPGGPHLHHDQDESWYVLAGDYVVELGSDRYRAQSRDCILGPRNISHAWAFVGGSPGRILIAHTPAGRIQEWFERDRKPGEYKNDAALYHAFGMELVGPPLSLK
jgi:mannose-6-phosphate isomerase-like protein (cupin superfamily)